MTTPPQVLIPTPGISEQGRAELRAMTSIAVSDLCSAPWHADTRYNESALEELGHHMLHYGQLQPIIARVHPDENARAPFQVIVGERRYRAAKLTGIEALTTLLLRECDDTTAHWLMSSDHFSAEAPDPYSETIIVLDHLASLLSTGDSWEDVVQREGGSREAAAWVINRHRRTYPHPSPSALKAIGIDPLVLKQALLTVFNRTSESNIHTFVRHRLPLFKLHPVLAKYVQTRELGAIKARQLNDDVDDQTMRERAEEAIASEQEATAGSNRDRSTRERKPAAVMKAVADLERALQLDPATLSPDERTKTAAKLKELAAQLEQAEQQQPA